MGSAVSMVEGYVMPGAKRIIHMKADTYDFELLPHVLGYEHEERIRTKGLKKNEFEFIKIIGISMFGAVYMCKHKLSGNYVACKSMWKREVLRLKQVESLIMEREVMQQLNHPFISRCGGSFQDANMLYLCVELAPGGDLFSMISRQEKRRLEDAQAKFYAASVVMALMYLHNRDLVYRALNTENVCLDAKGYIKLVDFQQVVGVVDMPNFGRNEFTGRRLRFADRWTVATHPGPELVQKLQKSEAHEVYAHERRRFTPHYFAPEVVQAKRHGKEADWWALGVLVYEMICGYPPYFDSAPPGLYEKILRHPLQYPIYVQPLAKDIMTKLLDKNRIKRLGHTGTEEVIGHNWFLNFAWQRLLYGRMKAPFIPSLIGPTDTKYFDKFPDSLMEESRFGAETKAVGALFQAYDAVGGPPITLLPPRHCMYGMDPHTKPSEETLQQWKEQSQMMRGGHGGEEEEDEADGEAAAGGGGDFVEEMTGEKQEIIDRLVEGYGVGPQLVVDVLNKVKWNEEKAGAIIEKQVEKREAEEEDDGI